PAGAVSAGIGTGGPVVDARADPVGLHARTRTLALTFDDGPDPEWTPRVPAVLAEHHAHATFFVTGARVARYPLRPA
ncbi:polysaccharide deacetylase family protein, partial [Amycolatopsis rifamycinica]|uniref:polysaccharide deacetylase family protein n=1 Tax=Amycolatopsis rifamycinica TaxID=287986 RepID=UPI0005C1EA70